MSWNTRQPVIFTHDNPVIHLGLCCINNSLRGTNKKNEIFCSRTLIRARYTKDRAYELAEKNLNDLKTLLIWNSQNNIHHFRISSDLFPRITDTTIPEKDRLKVQDFKNILDDIGQVIRTTGQRVTMHPGQYNQVGANSTEVFDSTVLDLSMHADVLDYMGCDDNSIITVHGGGTYKNKEKTKKRWCDNFNLLPSNVKSRLTIENCETQYSIIDCLDISDVCGIPIIFDCHHYACYNKKHSVDIDIDTYMPYILDTWRDRRPVFHISEQKLGARLGSHSDFIKEIPSYLLEIPLKYGVGFDLEVEAKAKEAAIFKLQQKYGIE